PSATRVIPRSSRTFIQGPSMGWWVFRTDIAHSIPGNKRPDFDEALPRSALRIRTIHRRLLERDPFAMNKNVCLLITVAIVTLSSAGCGNSQGHYPVYGKLLYKGQPAAGATVFFHPKGGANRAERQTPMGVVQEDGSFKLTDRDAEGARPGE